MSCWLIVSYLRVRSFTQKSICPLFSRGGGKWIKCSKKKILSRSTAEICVHPSHSRFEKYISKWNKLLFFYMTCIAIKLFSFFFLFEQRKANGIKLFWPLVPLIWLSRITFSVNKKDKNHRNTKIQTYLALVQKSMYNFNRVSTRSILDWKKQRRLWQPCYRLSSHLLLEKRLLYKGKEMPTFFSWQFFSWIQTTEFCLLLRSKSARRAAELPEEKNLKKHL